MWTLVDDSLQKFRGLSTDTKPAAAPGSEFLEMDTGKTYLYDAEGTQWTEQPASGGGPAIKKIVLNLEYDDAADDFVCSNPYEDIEEIRNNGWSGLIDIYFYMDEAYRRVKLAWSSDIEDGFVIEESGEYSWSNDYAAYAYTTNVFAFELDEAERSYTVTGIGTKEVTFTVS